MGQLDEPNEPIKEPSNIPQLIDSLYITALYNDVMRLLVLRPMENLAQGLGEEADRSIAELQNTLHKQVDECCSDLRKAIDTGDNH